MASSTNNQIELLQQIFDCSREEAISKSVELYSSICLSLLKNKKLYIDNTEIIIPGLGINFTKP